MALGPALPTSPVRLREMQIRGMGPNPTWKMRISGMSPRHGCSVLFSHFLRTLKLRTTDLEKQKKIHASSSADQLSHFLILAHCLLLCLSLQLLPLPSGRDSTLNFTGSLPRPQLVSTPPGCPLTVTLWNLSHSHHQHCHAQ